jgi:uncharacterized protein involved in response to NO
VLHYTGIYLFNFTAFTPNEWHAHEMVYGFAFAVIAGFLLTASAHWTNIKALQGWPLITFFSYFVFVRALFFFQPFSSKLPYILLDSLNQLILISWLIYLAIKAKHPRVLLMCVVIGGLMWTNFGYLNSESFTSSLTAINIIQLLFVLITGLIIPFFHRSALQPLRLNEDPFLRFALIAFMVVIVFQTSLENSELGKKLLLVSYMLGAALTVWRLYVWNMVRALQRGILFILYAGYSWIGVRLVLEALSLSGVLTDTTRLALHAFTFGAMGTIIIGMITRVSKGHTGRKVSLGSFGFLAYSAIILGAQLRVFGPLFFPAESMAWIKLSGALWILAYTFLAIDVARKLLGPRIDAKA